MRRYAKSGIYVVLLTAVAGVGEASQMKGDVRQLRKLQAGGTQLQLLLIFLSVGFAVGSLLLILAPPVLWVYGSAPCPLSNTDITEIPFASWLPSSAVLVEAYATSRWFYDTYPTTYVYKMTIHRGDLEELMRHTTDWDDEWLEQLTWTWMSARLVRNWLESSGAKKCYSYSADSPTRDGFDIITVCLDDSDVGTIYIEAHPAYQTGGW